MKDLKVNHALDHFQWILHTSITTFTVDLIQIDQEDTIQEMADENGHHKDKEKLLRYIADSEIGLLVWHLKKLASLFLM